MLLSKKPLNLLMSEGKVIVVTGISGAGSGYFCSGYAEESGKKVRIYNTADMVHRLAQPPCSGPPFPKENLLYLHPPRLRGLMGRAFENIASNLQQDKKDYDTILIDTHAQHIWDDVYTNTLDARKLNEIRPDMFVTIIDRPSGIKEAQQQTPYGRAQDHDLRDLLRWQNVEVNHTHTWAESQDKPMYVFSRKHNPLDLDPLLENWFLIYSSFPMTDAEGPATQKINEFKERLKELRVGIDGYRTPLIDPADIDVEEDRGLEQRIKNAVFAHTVHRDLVWDIEAATHVVAYYPDPEMDLSKGVSDECTRATELGKNVYVICPRERQSPFMGIATQVFRDEEEFFEFFGPHMREALEYFERSACEKRMKRSDRKN
jgi:adenylate kinase